MNDMRMIEARRLIEPIAFGRSWIPDLDFGCRVNRVVETELGSSWLKISEVD